MTLVHSYVKSCLTAFVPRIKIPISTVELLNYGWFVSESCVMDRSVPILILQKKNIWNKKNFSLFLRIQVPDSSKTSPERDFERSADSPLRMVPPSQFCSVLRK